VLLQFPNEETTAEGTLVARIETELFASLVGKISEGVIVTDADLDEPGPRILYVNTAFEEMTGYAFEEVEARSPRILQGSYTDRAVLDSLREALEAGRVFHGRTTNYRKDGTPFEVEWRVEPYGGTPDRPRYYLAILADVTDEAELHRRADRMELLHRIYTDVSARGLSLDGVRRGVAEVAMEITDAEAAVVEEPDGGEMVYRAAIGRAETYLGLRLPIHESVSGRCYRQRETLIVNDAESDERILLKETAREIGFRSAILTPLMHQAQCYGVLKVYSSESRRFSRDAEHLLDLASGILAAALFDAATFEEEVNRRHILLDAVPIFVAYIDPDRRYREVNRVHKEALGRTVSEIRGMYIWDVLGLENYERLRPYLDGALGGERVVFEVSLEGVGKGERILRGRFEPHFDPTDVVDGCYLTAQDITDLRNAEVDFLTGLFNRRKFEELAAYLLRSRERSELPMSVLMVDIDHFKAVNDKHGHAAGDDVLRGVAEILQGSLRKVDVACRWGGEEFAVLVHGADIDEAAQSAERFTSTLRAHGFGDIGGITASVGVAGAADNEELGEVLERADVALYEAKNAGRDRVVAQRG
jgi:diguanylate cyclase (GGDEF)-like protein/PAS domain S-box-containing protein